MMLLSNSGLSFPDYKTTAEGLFLKVNQQINNKNKIIIQLLFKLLLIKWDHQQRAAVYPLLHAAKCFHGST